MNNLRITNNEKDLARKANLIEFMNHYCPGRLMQTAVNEWRDSEHKDITIWKSKYDNMYKFKAHKKETQAINSHILGADTIAYVRRFCTDILERKSNSTNTYESAVRLLAEF